MSEKRSNIRVGKELSGLNVVTGAESKGVVMYLQIVLQPIDGKKKRVERESIEFVEENRHAIANALLGIESVKVVTVGESGRKEKGADDSKKKS